MEVLENEKFAEELMERYSSRGFGSMNKNDFEVMIFDLLKKYGDLKNKSNHQISLNLQIPETKVKRLDYESELKYNQKEKDVRSEFFDIISKAKIRGNSEKIEFIVESKYIRTSIAAKLKELGHYADASFNSEIIRVHYDSFIALLDSYYDPKSKGKIIDECKKTMDIAPSESDISFKLILKKFLYGMADEMGNKTVDVGFSLLTGGSDKIFDLIKSLKNFASK